MLEVGVPSAVCYRQLESRSPHPAAVLPELLLMCTGTIDAMSAK